MHIRAQIRVRDGSRIAQHISFIENKAQNNRARLLLSASTAGVPAFQLLANSWLSVPRMRSFLQMLRIRNARVLTRARALPRSVTLVRSSGDVTGGSVQMRAQGTEGTRLFSPPVLRSRRRTQEFARSLQRPVAHCSVVNALAGTAPSACCARAG